MGTFSLHGLFKFKALIEKTTQILPFGIRCFKISLHLYVRIVFQVSRPVYTQHVGLMYIRLSFWCMEITHLMWHIK